MGEPLQQLSWLASLHIHHSQHLKQQYINILALLKEKEEWHAGIGLMVGHSFNCNYFAAL
jgi:hypothetical protein